MTERDESAHRNPGSSRVAILHDRFPGIGGGEAFAIEAARVLDAPIYTAYIADGTEIPADVTVIPFRQSKYTSLPWRPFLEWKNEGMNPLETLNVSLDMTDAHDELGEYDVILESAPLSKYYVPDVDQRIVHYPHSPPRWLYDLYRDRLSSFRRPGVEAAVKGYAKLWRALDKEANDYVDRFVANSELVRDRIRRYYDEDATVVYPPVTGDWRNEGDDGYFLTWSRLAPEKRIDLIAEAFAGLDERLVIAGDGQQRGAIERIAEGHDNIEVRGYVEDIESLVAHCRAVVYAPKREDFGLVGAEAMSAGKPLLGVNEGFTRYQVEPGRTGLRFEPTVASIRAAVRRFDPDDFDAEEIQEIARRYAYDRFERDLRGVVEEVAPGDLSEPVSRPISHPDPDVSVVVPTMPANDHDAVVSSLADQTADGFEVFIVDDPDVGVCGARNRGLRRAAGDIVAFTDDDCRPPADWIASIRRAFAETDGLVVLEGPVEGGMSYEGRRKYPTCNLAVDREAALSVGGFDERFEYWREDTEFGWRLEEYGAAAYDNRVRMVHPDPPRSSIVEENEALLRRTYPEKYEELIVPDTLGGRVNDWLWRRGVWDAIDEVRNHG